MKNTKNFAIYGENLLFQLVSLLTDPNEIFEV